MYMATESLDFYIDLDSKRLVRPNDFSIGLRQVELAEGSSISGFARLVSNGTAIPTGGISYFSLELANDKNDTALRNFKASGNSYGLDIIGATLRNYLYNTDSKRGLLNIALTNSGQSYFLQSLPVVLTSNPDENLVSNGDTFIQNGATVYIQQHSGNIVSSLVSIENSNGTIQATGLSIEQANISNSTVNFSGVGYVTGPANISGGVNSTQGSTSIIGGNNEVSGLVNISGNANVTLSNVSILGGNNTVTETQNVNISGGNNTVQGFTATFYSGQNIVTTESTVIVNGEADILINGGAANVYGNAYVSGDITFNDNNAPTTINNSTVGFSGTSTVTLNSGIVQGGNNNLYGNATVNGGTNILSGSSKASITFWLDTVFTGNAVQELWLPEDVTFTGLRLGAAVSGRGGVHLNSGASGLLLNYPLVGQLYQRTPQNNAIQFASFTFNSGELYQVSGASNVQLSGNNRLGINILSGLSGIQGFSVGLYGYQTYGA